MLKILLLAIGLAQLAYASDGCAKGPSYWCRSVATSHECNAFKHCLQTVWSMHAQFLTAEPGLTAEPSPNPNKCTNCLMCVDAQNSFCPYVKDFGDEIEQMRASKLPGSTICKLLEQCESRPIIDEGGLDARFECGLHPRQHCDTLESAHKCASFETCFNQWSQLPYKYVLSTNGGLLGDVKSEKTCGFCIFLFNKLHSVLELNETEVDIEQYLMGACSLLPTKNETDLCVDSVQKYLPDIIKMVRNNLDPGIICRVIKLCDDKLLTPIKIEPSEAEKLRMNQELREFIGGVRVRVVNEDQVVIETPLSPPKHSPPLLGSKDETLVATLKQSMGVGCELCQIVLSAAKHLVEKKVDDEKVLAFIDKELCSRLGTYKTACSDYIKLEGKQILDLLRKAVDPALICEMMGFCLKVQLSHERLFDLDVRNTLNCTLCKMVFSEVKKKLAAHDEEERIIGYINKELCERVGKSKEACKSLMEAYGPLFLEIVARDINPAQLCEIIGMCTKSADESLPWETLEPAVGVTTKSNDTCVVCEFVIKLVSDYVSKNSTEPEIEKALQMVCNKIIPSSVRPQCNQFVEQYGPVVISLIVNGMKPDQICRFVGLCPKLDRFVDEEHLFKHRAREMAREKEQDLVKIDSENKKQTLQCSLCLYVTELVDTMLKQNKTDEQITKEVELVCNLFPGDLKDECKSFVDEYAPYIIQLIALELDSEATCAALKLCNKTVEHDIFRRTFVNKLPHH